MTQPQMLRFPFCLKSLFTKMTHRCVCVFFRLNWLIAILPLCKSPVNVTQTPPFLTNESLRRRFEHLPLSGSALRNKPITPTSRPPARRFLRNETWKQTQKRSEMDRNSQTFSPEKNASNTRNLYYVYLLFLEPTVDVDEDRAE